MDRIALLDLLYDGHSCDDCDEQISCKTKNHLCDQWGIMSAETLLVVSAGKEFARALDEYALKQMVKANG